MSIGKIFGVFNISGSGLSAQRKNLEVRAQNIANSESVDEQTGEPYRAKDIRFTVVDNNNGFESLVNRQKLTLSKTASQHFSNLSSRKNFIDRDSGVNAAVVENASQQTKLIYAPDHPMANDEGYLQVADIDPIGEMVELMSAARAYEANATVINSAKDMFDKALEI